MTPKFHFEPSTHTYTLSGQVIPAVTKIIGQVLPRRYECANWYLEKGAALHACIHLLVQGKLRWESVDERIAGRLRAWVKFQSENKTIIVGSEERYFSERYQFAGTCDARINFGKENVLVDVKSSLEPQLGPQLGAYALLLKENKLYASIACGLWLREDSTYRVKWFTASELRRAEQVFLSCLNVYRFGKQEGLYK